MSWIKIYMSLVSLSYWRCRASVFSPKTFSLDTYVRAKCYIINPLIHRTKSRQTKHIYHSWTQKHCLPQPLKWPIISTLQRFRPHIYTNPQFQRANSVLGLCLRPDDKRCTQFTHNLECWVQCLLLCIVTKLLSFLSLREQTNKKSFQKYRKYIKHKKTLLKGEKGIWWN